MTTFDDRSPTELPLRDVLTRLAARARRRRRVRAAWAALAVAAALAAFLVAWESSATGRAWRPAGYLAALGSAAAGLAAGARGARAGGPGPAAVAARIERLWPQTRGLLRDAGAAADPRLAGARAGAAAAWLARRSPTRLDRALAEEECGAAAAWRRAALAALALVMAAVAAQPATGRRAAAALAGGWGAEAARWSVEPGDVTVEYGGAVAGRVRHAGPAAEGPLAIEWRPPGGAWRTEVLGDGPEAAWRWEDLRAPREYRPRRGAASGPVHRIEVRAPFHLRGVEARSPGGAWASVAGRVFPAGRPLELRGTASADPAWVELRSEGSGPVRLAVRGREFSGTLRPAAGVARVAARDRDGREWVGPLFRVAPAGAAFASILAPADDPVRLEAAGLALTVRAGAGAGLARLAWETTDGRGGPLAAVAGARDTTVTAVAPVAVGLAPGDTLAYRVVAVPSLGRPTATAWRRAVVPDLAAIRAGVDRERTAAGRALDRALTEARDGVADGAGRADDGDRTVRAAADSLAAAIERTLADPGIDPGLAGRLEEARRMLEGAAEADLSPRPGIAPDPAREAAARAATIEAIREHVRRLEEALERSRAPDDLERLADAERDLARETRTADAEQMESIAARQAELEAAGREAADRLGDPAAASEVAASLERARAAVEAGRAAEAEVGAASSAQSAAAKAAAQAQTAAAERMDAAAEGAREAAAAEAADRDRRLRALDRAGAEALWLARAQQDLAEGAGAPAERAARQSDVSRGLERALGTLVEGIGGQPAARELAAALTRAVAATRAAEAALAAGAEGGAAERAALADAAAGGAAERAALADAAAALTGLSSALLLPEADPGADGMPGAAGAQGETGGLSRELARLAEAQRALADAAGEAGEAGGGNPDAPGEERRIAEALAAMRERLAAAGVDPATAEALARAARESAERLERGLAGARRETELRSLARRIEDLARALDDSREERRRSEPARPFLPASPPALPGRVTAPRLDPAGALAPFEGELPAASEEAARRYLERLAAEGVRSPEAAP